MARKVHFQKLVDEGGATGEVIGVNRFLLEVKGLDGVAVGATVVFENGERGMVRQVMTDTAIVMNFEAEMTPLGTLLVLEDNVSVTHVGESLIGRVVTPLGRPLDGKGALSLTKTWPLFHPAPGLMERAMLDAQLPSGVTVVDSLFPIVLGQRIAILGDTKSGKTTFLSQLGVSQLGSGRIVVYVLIGKRRVDIDRLIAMLEQTGAIEHSVVVVANIFDSMAQSYIAPYVGCAIAEFLWQSGRDVVIVYDDLSSHAKVHREISLLTEANPGRDSYPGDMFFAHSSLLERAGKLKQSGKTLTALPVVLTPSDDITAYLPTSIMSITDGQIIFDISLFRRNIRPAVHTGLSVSRVGGRVQNARQKRVSTSVFKSLAAYRQALEFSQFGTELSPEAQQMLRLGQLLYEIFRQAPAELYSVAQQQVMLEVALLSGGARTISVVGLKEKVRTLTGASLALDGAAMDHLIEELLNQSSVEVAS